MSDDRDAIEQSAGHEPAPPAEPSRLGFPWSLTAFLIGVILLVVFVVQNVQEVALRFLGWEGEYPLSLIIILVIAISVLLDEFLGAVIRRRNHKRRAERAELRRLRHEQ